jgi:uncharacterized repeat protein (TIGR03803 family)/ELWxxDGT repeat protein
MKTNLLSILTWFLTASAVWCQPRVVEYLSDGYYMNSAADVNGTLFYSEYHTLMKYSVDDGTGHLKELGGKAVNLKNVNGILYFTVYNHTADESSLWKSDGTREGTIPVIRFSDTFNQISPLVTLDATVYFGFQDQLFKTDGTENGTTVVKDLAAASNDGLLRLVALDNVIYIAFRKTSGNYELWRSDGTESGTTFVRDFGFIEFLESVGGSAYFVGDDGATGRELWRATPSGEVFLEQDINPGNNNSFDEGDNVSAAGAEVMVFSTPAAAGVWSIYHTPVLLAHMTASEIVASGRAFYFIVEDEVWTTNGTVDGTVLLKKFPGKDNRRTRISNLTSHNNTVFFVVDGKQLWQSDGSPEGTVMIHDHNPGLNTTGTIFPVSVGNLLYYFGTFMTAGNDTSYPELYEYDPATVWVPYLYLVDAATDEDIGLLQNNAVIYTDQEMSLRADASLPAQSVAFYINGGLYRKEKARPFSLAGDNNGNYNAWNPSPANYEIRVIPYNSTGGAGSGLTYNISVEERETNCASGTILREYWNNTKGNTVSAIPVYIRPSGREMLTVFEGPVNAGKNYSARIKGYVCPPVSGDYTFWISSNDHSELWLSRNDDPRNKQKIASVSGATASREWEKFRSQKSALVHLEAGQRYYIEALHKQGDGTDHVAVGWQLPGGEMERPIPENRLSPFTGNYPPEVSIITPVDGQVFNAPATIDIEAEGGDHDGFITRFELYAGDKLLEAWNSRFTWSSVPEGTYVITVKATDDDGAVTISAPVTITVRGQCTASGTITREYWTGVQGNRVADIPMTKPPSGEQTLSLFEGPQNEGTNYGARIRGFICPPASGNYVFWISSNDHSELWLSPNPDPIDKKKVAYVSGATNPREWNKFASQRSVSIPLQQGKKYYIEALHKQGVGTDNLAVGWQLPDGTMERPITGGRLSPYADIGDPAARVISPADGSSDIDPLVMKMQVRPVESASRYSVQVSETPDFGGDVRIINSLEDHQIVFILKDLKHATTYYARVKTNVSAYGPISKFTTRDVIPQQRLWGLTREGGKYGMGTIFSFSVDSSHFVKHYDKDVVRYGEGEDEYYDERMLGSPVTGPDGTLYGQSDHDYSGDLFVMDKEGDVRWLQANVFLQQGNIMLGSDNNVYATTRDYLIGGTISKYNIDDPALSRSLRNFEPQQYGGNPEARLLELANGFFYGAAFDGGVNNGGTLYRIRGSGTDFEVIHYFDRTNGGMNPRSGLIEYNGYLFGTTAYGGAVESAGTVYRISANGSDLTKIHNFDGINGRNPFGELIVMDGVLYGMTTEGGTFDQGIVYRLNVDGSGFAKLHDFSGADGSIPSGALTHDRDGNLYGMTSYGGAHEMGVVFKIHSRGTGFVKLFDFSATSGGRPNGSLVIREDTFSPTAMAMNVHETEASFSVSVHPNPSTDNFNVHVQTPGKEKIQLVISDQYGNTIASYEMNNNTPTEVGADLKRGLYVMKFMQGKQIAMKRVVKK